MWAESGRPWAPRRGFAPKPISLLVVGDLLDQVDDAPSQLGIVDARERLGEGEAVRGGEKIGHIGGRGRLTDVVDQLIAETAGRWPSTATAVGGDPTTESEEEDYT